jgi:hypothetical protein
MSSFATLKLEIDVKDKEFKRRNGVSSVARFSPGANLTNGKRETVTLTASAFTALSPPSGASALVIEWDKEPNNTIINLTLKGVTGDTGITHIPSSNPKNIPLVLPLGASPSIGILNSHGSNQVIEILWL